MIEDYNRDLAGVLNIRPAEFGDHTFVEFVAGDGSTACSSPIGRHEGLPVQRVRCDPDAFAGQLKHELGHAIGLFHEHQRPNRGQFVDINMDNVIDDSDIRRNFETRRSDGQEIGPYDLGSIMHYFEHAFAIDWSYGERVHGGQRSSATPALAVLNGEIHMVYKRRDSHDLRHARWTGTADAGNWSDDVPVNLGQQSSTTPALAVLNNELHMVHLGSTGSPRTLWHSRWIPSDLGNWERNERITLRETSTAPALASFDGRLHMVALGTTGSRILHHSVWDPSDDLGKWDDDKAIAGRESSITPALAEWGGELHLVALGSPGSNTLWHSRWNSTRPVGNWTPDKPIHSDARRSAPALCNYGTLLHLAYSGTGSNVRADGPAGAAARGGARPGHVRGSGSTKRLGVR